MHWRLSGRAGISDRARSMKRGSGRFLVASAVSAAVAVTSEAPGLPGPPAAAVTAA